MKYLAIITLWVFGIDARAQTDTIRSRFDFTVEIVLADLNKDDLLDKVVVSQDTLDESAPYQLEIFFQETDGQFKSVASTVGLIKPRYPYGKDYDTGERFSDVMIEKGIITIVTELLRGHYQYRFRFHDNRFELIDYSMVNSDGNGTLHSVSFDLLKGIRIEKIINYETDELIKKTKTKVKIRPLPRLEEINGTENFLI